jgi:hypothetical protein
VLTAVVVYAMTPTAEPDAKAKTEVGTKADGGKPVAKPTEGAP